ncbi:MAG: lytic transglycosylase domain-containing protein [Candidatus Sericytochromatia bacterium]|nr:lytic transglycosylase domain-containing protein [Candidatus Tanganyikabacteria bacterium]
MRTRVLALALTLLATTGCFGRAARYDPADPAPEGQIVAPRELPGEAIAPPVLPAELEERLVRFIRWRNRRLSPEQARHIAVALATASAAQRLDHRLLACLVAVESSFDPRARSRTGAAGLGQLLPSTARELGVSDPHDVDQNLQGTALYLQRMLAAWDGREDLALASYFEGLGTIRKQVAAGKPLTPAQILFVQRVTGLYDRI